MALEPITRAEQIMSGKSLTPITREEMFLAKAGGQDVQTPTPITRKEMFLQKIAENGGGSGGGSGGGTGGENWIGDGNTHIWISLPEGRTSPMLGVGINGTVTVDWGDGTTPDVLTGTSTTRVKWTPNHEYGGTGDYVITLTVDGEIGFYGNDSTDGYSAILRYSSSGDTRNKVYQNAVRRLEIGNSVASIGNYAFYNCYSLTSINITGSVTSIGNDAFNRCHSLVSVAVGNSVTSIGTNAFNNCGSMVFYDFTNHAAVPTLSNTNAFTRIPADCEIRVPAALYDEWIAATNWSTYASKIVAV